MDKRAPRRFTYAQSNNFYVPVLVRANNPSRILIDSFDGETVTGLIWEGDRFRLPVKLPVADLSEAELEVSHIFRGSTFEYESLTQFWKATLSWHARRLQIAERIRQFFFNSTTRFRHDRIFVLKRLIEDRVEREKRTDLSSVLGNDFSSSIEFFKKVYGQRAFAHPSYEEAAARFDLILQSLAESGDLEQNGTSQFKLRAKALITISDYEQAERMHDDNVRHNNRVLWLTIILAAATIIQAGVAYSNLIVAP